MVKAYPQFRSSYSHEEMVEHFLLTPAENKKGSNSLDRGLARLALEAVPRATPFS